MDALPLLDEQAPVRLNDGKGHAQIPLRHAPVGQHGEVEDIDAGFPVSINMGVRRFMVIGVYDKSHAGGAENGDHASK
jgi:hypothetical protein